MGVFGGVPVVCHVGYYEGEAEEDEERCGGVEKGFEESKHIYEVRFTIYEFGGTSVSAPSELRRDGKVPRSEHGVLVGDIIVVFIRVRWQGEVCLQVGQCGFCLLTGAVNAQVGEGVAGGNVAQAPPESIFAFSQFGASAIGEGNDFWGFHGDLRFTNLAKLWRSFRGR